MISEEDNEEESHSEETIEESEVMEETDEDLEEDQEMDTDSGPNEEEIGRDDHTPEDETESPGETVTDDVAEEESSHPLDNFSTQQITEMMEHMTSLKNSFDLLIKAFNDFKGGADTTEEELAEEGEEELPQFGDPGMEGESPNETEPPIDEFVEDETPVEHGYEEGKQGQGLETDDLQTVSYIVKYGEVIHLNKEAQEL